MDATTNLARQGVQLTMTVIGRLVALPFCFLFSFSLGRISSFFERAFVREKAAIVIPSDVSIYLSYREARFGRFAAIRGV